MNFVIHCFCFNNIMARRLRAQYTIYIYRNKITTMYQKSKSGMYNLMNSQNGANVEEKI
jgi:hypothetical protein